MRVLGRQQQLLRVDFEEGPGEACLTSLRSRVIDQIAGHDMLVLSDYAKGALSHVEQLIQAARAAGVPVLVDPKGHLYRRYRGATLVTPNRVEMQEAVGRWQTESELSERAQHLRIELELRSEEHTS